MRLGSSSSRTISFRSRSPRAFLSASRGWTRSARRADRACRRSARRRPRAGSLGSAIAAYSSCSSLPGPLKDVPASWRRSQRRQSPIIVALAAGARRVARITPHGGDPGCPCCVQRRLGSAGSTTSSGSPDRCGRRASPGHSAARAAADPRVRVQVAPPTSGARGNATSAIRPSSGRDRSTTLDSGNGRRCSSAAVRCRTFSWRWPDREVDPG